MANLFSSIFLLLFCISTLNSLDELETKSETPFYNPPDADAIIQQYFNGEKSFKSVFYHNLDVTNLNEVTLPLQNKGIKILKVTGSPRLTSIAFKRQSTLSPLASSLVNLDLSHNALNFKHQDEMHAFSYMENLQQLNLSHNNISATDILMAALGNLKNIKRLDLKNNRELNFGEHGFPASLGQLELLDLSYCNVFNPTDVIFVNLVNLKELRLEGNGLSVLPKSLCNQPSLHIYLRKTHINERYGKYLREKCTVKITFEIRTEIQNVGDINYCEREMNWWFWLFIGFIIVAGVLTLILILAPYETCD
uniref:Uncharacterized protein n=1 Tax=Panagrolaimus sp. ES5 TaxID=591445 RepID=A0AC34GXU4_9BILA